MATQAATQATKTEIKSSSENPNPFLSDDLRLSMWIPAELAGKVIGKKGIVISNIKRESQANFITAMQPVGDSLWTAVVILGSAAAVFTAYKAVANMVDNEVDDVILEFEVSKNNKHAYLTTNGINNQLVRKLSAETNIRIFIPNLGTHPHSATLEGEATNVQKAFQLLVKLHNNPVMQEEWSNTSNITTTTAVASLGTSSSVANTTTLSTSLSSSSSTAAQKKSITTISSSSLDKQVGGDNKSSSSSSSLQGIKEKQKDTTKHARDDTTKTKTNVKKASSVTVVEDKKLEKDEKIDTMKQLDNDNDQEEEENDDDEGDENRKEDPLLTTSTNTTPRVYIEKSIDIPSTLVGLLLARRPDPPGTTSYRGRGRSSGRFGNNSNSSYHKNIINQIQSLTHTVITRTSGPKKYVKSTNKNSISATKSTDATVATGVDDEHAEDDNDDDDDDDKHNDSHNNKDDNEKLIDDVKDKLKIDDSDNYIKDESQTNSDIAPPVVASVIVAITEEVKSEDVDNNDKVESEVDATAAGTTVEETVEGVVVEPPVTFKVSGMTEEQADMALEHIAKIIAGDRIKDVIAALKIKSTEMFPSRYSSTTHESFSDAMTGGGRVSSCGRGRGRGRFNRDDGRDSSRGGRGRGRGRGFREMTPTDSSTNPDDIDMTTNTNAIPATGENNNNNDDDDDNANNNSNRIIRRPRVIGGRFRSGRRVETTDGSSSSSSSATTRSKPYTRDARKLV